jgi:hypothetical protein
MTERWLIPQELETPRLHLRRFEEADWDALCQIFEDDDCVRYTATSGPFRSAAARQRFSFTT